MQHLFSGMERSLPQLLQADLEELATWDNNCYLTWVQLDDEEAGSWRKFTVRLWSDGRQFGLALDFGVPEWMDLRAAEAILPAHLSVTSMDRGRRAVVETGLKQWPRLKESLPKTARTCARLINELWGPTEGDDVMLVGIDYLETVLPVSFAEIPGHSA